MLRVSISRACGAPEGGERLIRFSFNGKEKDDEVKGLGNSLDYGARIYDPRIGSWLSIDPLAMKFPFSSPYSFVLNNPVNAIDPDGRDVLFINGYIGFGSPPAGEKYWSQNFVKGATDYFNDPIAKFTSYQPGMFSTAAERKAAGIAYAKEHFGYLTKGMTKEKDVYKIVTHSMGAAFGEGVTEYLQGEGWKVETIVHVNPFQAADIKTTDPNSNQTQTIDYQNPDDWVINELPTASPGNIQGADSKIREQSGDENSKTRHTSPIWKQGENFWKSLKSKIIMSSPKDDIPKAPAKDTSPTG
ncbi:MAG: RHS repeat domain-containing protein [Bacteroidia bacterium]